MGRAEVIRHVGDGLYEIRLRFDSKAARDRVAAIGEQIARAEIERQQTLRALNTATAARLYACEHQGAETCATATAEVTRLRLALSVVEARMAGLQHDRAWLSAQIPEDRAQMAWCADLVEDVAAGTIVGTIEVPGEPEAHGRTQMHPAWDGAAAYRAGRDHVVTPAVSMDPFAAFVNRALSPGWMRWLPVYRYGILSEIDVASDTGTVTLDETRANPWYGGADVNATPSLRAVPIIYMDCNARAFAQGDHVLVRFEGQDWTRPTVIGFHDHPQPCQGVPILLMAGGNALARVRVRYAAGSEPFLVGETLLAGAETWGPIVVVDPISAADVWLVGDWPTGSTKTSLVGETSGASGSILESSHRQKWHYRSTWNFREIYHDPVLNRLMSRDVEPQPVEDRIRAAIVAPTDTDGVPITDQGWDVVDQVLGRTWHKYYDDVGITAFEHGPITTLSRRWSVCATFRGVACQINGLPYWGDRPLFAARSTEITETHIGFDVWMEGGEYHLALLAEELGEGYFEEFVLDEGARNFVRVRQQRTAILSVYGSNLDGRLRLVGFGRREAWWTKFGGTVAYHEDFSAGGTGVIAYDLGDPAPGQGQILDALWNPIAREIKWCVDGSYTTTALAPFVTYNHYLAQIFVNSPYFCKCLYNPELDDLGRSGCEGANPFCSDNYPTALPGSAGTYNYFGTINPVFAATFSGTGTAEHYTRHMAYDGGQEIEHGVFRIGGVWNFGKGTTTTWASCTWKITRNGGGSGQPGGVRYSLCETDRRWYELAGWMWTPPGGQVVKYRVRQDYTEFGVDAPAWVPSCTEAEYGAYQYSAALGDPSCPQKDPGPQYFAYADAWPHHSQWKAILLHATVPRGDDPDATIDVAPAVWYVDGVCRSGSIGEGCLSVSDFGQFQRHFFQRM